MEPPAEPIVPRTPELINVMVQAMQSNQLANVNVDALINELEKDGYRVRPLDNPGGGKTIICFKDINDDQRLALAQMMLPITLGENLENKELFKRMIEGNKWALESHSSFECSIKNAEGQVDIRELLAMFPPVLLGLLFGSIAGTLQAAKEKLEAADAGVRKVTKATDLIVRTQTAKHATYNLVQIVNETPMQKQGEAKMLELKLTQTWIKVDVEMKRILFFRYQKGVDALNVETNMLLVPTDTLVRL